MNERIENSGVYIAGGNVSGPVAAGRNAQAIQNNTQAPAVVRIEVLLGELETEARTLLPAHAEDVSDDVSRLREEVKRRRPSADSLRMILGRLSGAVAGTATLLAKVDQIKDLIGPLVH